MARGSATVRKVVACRCCFLAVAACLNLLSPVCDAIADDAQLRDRYLDEAPRGWAKLRQLTESFQGGYQETIVNTDKGRETKRMVRRLEYKRRKGDGLMLVEVRLDPDTGPKSVTGGNESYSFELHRGIEGAPFQVTRYNDSNPKGDSLLANYLAYIEAAYSVGGYTLDAIVRDPQFRLTDIESVEYRGLPMVRVAYEGQTEVPGARAPVPLECWAILDPDQSWAVRESFMRRPQSGGILFAIEYRKTPVGIPFPSRLTRVTTSETSDVRSEQILVYDEPAKCDAAPEAFRLSAFGLPEMAAGSAWIRGRRLRFGLIANLALVATIAILIWWRKNKSRKGMATESGA